MVRLATVLLLLCATLGPARAGSLDTPRAHVSPLTPEVRYRPDAIVIQLRPEASRLLRGIRSEPRPMVTRVERLGVSGLDRVASDMGGVWFEPEFPNDAIDRQGAVPSAALGGFYIVHLPPGSDRDRAVDAFRRVPEVERADPIAIVPVQVIPNDSLWSSAYYFYQSSRHDMSAVPAWDICRGDTAVSVGILDTGVLLDHPDLRDQIQINWPERNGIPGVDDDGNGYVDDDRGWDFVALDSALLAVPAEDWRDEDNDPNDFVGHGTAVAGLVAAQTNNRIGISSVAWNARLLPLRIGWSSSRAPSGEIDLSYVARAMVYATRLGARVLNCSFTSVRQADLIAAADFATRSGVAIVASAGNGERWHYLPDRDDVIGVAATDRFDHVAAFSNRGDFVDVAAAGVDVAITSVTRTGRDSLGSRRPTYATGSGTSFAAPLVSGAVALIQSYRLQCGLPLLSPYEAQIRLIETADDISAENPGVTGYGSGRINLLRALTGSQGSLVLPSDARTVGPGIVIPTRSGVARIYFAREDGRLLIANAARDAIPRTVTLPGVPMAGLAAADLGHDRGIGIFATVKTGTGEGFIVAGFDPDGRPLPGWPVSGFGRGGTAESALGDLDGDGALEVVRGSGDGRVWAWRADGTSVPGFPRVLDNLTRQVQIALSDLNGEPGVEIIAAVQGGAFHAIRGDGTYLPGWPPALGFAAVWDPVVMRLGTDPNPVVVGAEDPNRLVALRADGTIRWERSISGIQALPLTAGDLDGNGTDEIVLARWAPTRIVALDSLGSDRIGWDAPGFTSAPPPASLLVASLAPKGAAGVLHFTSQGWLQAYDARGGRVGPLPLPGGAGRSSSVFDVDGDGRTEVVAGSGQDSAIYVYEAGLDTWNAAAQSWPTARGNFARTGSRLYAPALGLLDDIPPEGVSDLRATEIGAHTVELRWTAPEDDGDAGRPSRYDLRYSFHPIDEASFPTAQKVPGLPTPAVPGESERMMVLGLDEVRIYYFAIRSVDTAGNSSPISTLTVTTGSVRPDPVRDLTVISWSDTSVTVRWIATGDDASVGHPAVYRLAADPDGPLDEAGFEGAPIRMDVVPTADAGRFEWATLGGLKRGHRYWVAIRAEDERGSTSGLSSLVSTWVGPLASRSGLALSSGTQPARVPVELYWQQPYPVRGEIVLYDLGGRRVRSFVTGGSTEGIEFWDGRDRSGNRLESGVYFARFTSGTEETRARIVLVR